MDLIDKNVDVSSIDVPDVKSEEVLNSYHQIVKNSRNNSNRVFVCDVYPL